MIARQLEKKLRAAARQYPVVSVTGPRQSGKTTLVRATFDRHDYVSLEAPDHREFAREDPRGFLGQFRKSVVLDEVQRAPDLLSYIQSAVDGRDRPGQFILTGSQNFLLMEKISQTLAGRCAVLHLMPFSLAELDGRAPLRLDAIGRAVPRRAAKPPGDLFQTLITGFYPRIHDKRLDPRDWLGNYYQTYVERDVRTILNVGDIEAFGRFVRLCAGRSGHLLNLSALAADCGITHGTARSWLSVLEASFIVRLLRPHHRNFNKRLVKRPKLYFLDTGLLCYLLGIRSADELRLHAARGPVFETFVISEILKNFMNRAERPPVYFWRDMRGHELDVLIDFGSTLIPVEIKSGETVAGDFDKGLRFWRQLCERPDGPAALVYAGGRSFKRGGVAVYSWAAL